MSGTYNSGEYEKIQSDRIKHTHLTCEDKCTLEKLLQMTVKCYELTGQEQFECRNDAYTTYYQSMYKCRMTPHY